MVRALVNEEASKLVDFKIISESHDHETKQRSVIFESIIQELDTPNGNRRVYDTSLFKSIMPLIQKRIELNEMIGELDHPLADIMKATKEQDAIKRQISIFLTKASHVFLEIKLDGKYVRSKIRTLHTSKGQELFNLIVLDKIAIGLSMRSIGNWISKNGYNYISQANFQFVTYDAVWNPSNLKARFIPISDSYSLSESNELFESITSSNNNIICKEGNIVCNNSLLSEFNNDQTNSYIIPSTIKKQVLSNIIEKRILSVI